MQGHLAEGRASGTTYSPNRENKKKGVPLRSKEWSLFHDVPYPLPRPPGFLVTLLGKALNLFGIS